MIPKIIHYCWLSDDPIPPDLQEYIDGWQRLLPDYEIIKWDFNRFPRGVSVWVEEAFEKKKYAFAADYIRLYALYNMGGIYLDSDVEVLRSFDPFLEMKEMICYENSDRKGLEMAVIGCEPHRLWTKQCLDYYENRHFVLKNGLYDTKVLPEVVKDILLERKWEFIDIKNIDEYVKTSNGYTIPVLPFEYFSPKSFIDGKIYLTNNTYSIHHFAGSWYGRREKLYRLLCLCIGHKNAKKIAERIKKLLK